MELPFSHDDFLDVFGAYNSALWPLVAVLWIATTGFVVNWWYTGRIESRSTFGLLALHWAVSGVAYQWYFFRSINPAATLFAALFVAQSAVFVWLAVASRHHFSVSRNLRGALGGTLIVYGLVYPVVGIVFGLRYPRMPVFAVPCPTTLVTAGLLISSHDVPRFTKVMPIIWAGIGGSAAFALDIRADMALVVTGVVLALDTLVPRALGVKSAA